MEVFPEMNPYCALKKNRSLIAKNQELRGDYAQCNDISSVPKEPSGL
jgi:hypothetical protein